MKHLSLRLKLIAAFMVITLLVGSASMYMLYGIQYTKTLLVDIIDNDLARIDALQQIKFITADIQRDALEYGQGILPGSAEDGSKNAKTHMQQLQKELSIHTTAYTGLEGDDVTGENEELFQRITTQADGLAQQALQLVENEKLTPAQQQAFQIELDKNHETLSENIEQLLQTARQKVNEENVETEAVVAQLVLFASIAAGGAFLIAIVLGVLTSSSLSRRIIRLKQGADSIASGDLSKNLEVGAKDELGQVAIAFNLMGQRLKDSYGRLALEKERAETVLKSMGEGLVALDNENKIVIMNTVATKLLEIEESAIVGKPITEAVHFLNDDNEPISPTELPIVTTQRAGKIATGVLTYLTKENRKILVSVTASHINLDGKVAGTILVLRDVTKEREVDRMKTEFISLASHQLRTPLSAIKWFSEMLISGDAGKLTPDQLDFSKNIYDSTNRMVELVNSLLNISRIESGRIMVDPKPTALRDLVGGIVNDLQAKIQEQKQNLVISVHSDLPKINLDPRLIGQVYLNLLTNAIKYTPKGGEISVFVSKKDDQVISQVTDNGYGIPKDQQDHIFQKFFRAENVAKHVTDGTGLGLYLIKAIVESSGGKIWFESDEGKGTTFWFSIPLSGMKAKKGEVTLDN